MTQGPRNPKGASAAPTNYITPEGARKLQNELIELRTKLRPKIVQEVADAAAQGDRSENAEYIYGKKKLREIDRRMHFLTKRLDAAVIVEPRTDGSRKIFFGAFVEIEDEDGKSWKYRLVGEDEIDLKAGFISWKSPMGRALLGKSEGDAVTVQRPTGPTEVVVLSVRYQV